MTDLNAHALFLLSFIEDSLNEALANPTAMLEPLSEADCSLSVLKKAPLKDDERKFATLMLMGVMDINFLSIAKGNPVDPNLKLQEALQCVLNAKEALRRQPLTFEVTPYDIIPWRPLVRLFLPDLPSLRRGLFTGTNGRL
jgi:hypothetical protein